MITKAVVESIVDTYRVKIRMPLLDRIKSSNIHTPDSDLEIATVCTLPNCRANLRVGDVVFVATEEAYPNSKPVIIGHLYRENIGETYCDLILDELKVRSTCRLPGDTQIGNVSSDEIGHLSGASDNIQKQISDLLNRVTLLEEQVFHKEIDENNGGDN